MVISRDVIATVVVRYVYVHVGYRGRGGQTGGRRRFGPGSNQMFRIVNRRRTDLTIYERERTPRRSPAIVADVS